MQRLQDCRKTKRYVVRVPHSSRGFRSILATALRYSARLPCDSLAADVRQMRGWRTITSVIRTPYVSCSSPAAALCVLRLSYGSQKTQTNRKENEHVENSLRQPCDLVFRTAVLRCSLLHREAAAGNPEICRRGQVQGCRKADVTLAFAIMFAFCERRTTAASHTILPKGCCKTRKAFVRLTL